MLFTVGCKIISYFFDFDLHGLKFLTNRQHYEKISKILICCFNKLPIFAVRKTIFK